MRILATTILLSCLSLTFLSPAGSAAELRLAAWNLEHLNDTDREGYIPRRAADYAALQRRAMALDADIVAFQEVENAAAARRVFPASDWHVQVSGRPATGKGPECRGRPGAHLKRLAIGFAIRRGIAYRRNADLEDIANGNRYLRWGTDITVTAGGRELRLLSVHLKSGCWGEAQDRRGKKACAVLRAQVPRLAAWAGARRAEGMAFVILGDFNRRLAVRGD